MRRGLGLLMDRAGGLATDDGIGTPQDLDRN